MATTGYEGVISPDQLGVVSTPPPESKPPDDTTNRYAGVNPPAVPPEPSFLDRAFLSLHDLPATVARDLTPTINMPGSAPSTPAPGLSSSSDVPPQIVSNPNAYMARGVRDVTDKLTEYPNPEYGYTPEQSALGPIRTQNAADRAEFNQKYGYDAAMPWFRGVGQTAAVAPVLGPLTSMAGAGIDAVIPGAGTFLTGGAGAEAKGLPGFAARTLSRSAAGGTLGAGASALTADPSKPLWPQIQEGGLWGLGTGAALSPVLEGAGQLATRPLPGEAPPVTNTGLAKTITNNAYKAADAAGAGLTSDAVNGAIDDVGKITTVPADAQAFVGPNDATKTVADLGVLRDKPLSLSGLQAVAEDINTRIDAHVQPDGSLDKVGNRLVQIKNSLLDSVDNAGPSGVTGDASGFDAWNDGRKAFGYQMQMRDLERIRQQAAGADDPAQYIKTQVNGMVNDDARMRGWSPDDKAALTNVGKTGYLSDVGSTLADRFIGSTLMGGAGALGGSLFGPLGTAIGGAGGVAVQTALRRGILALQQGSAQRGLQGVITGLGENIRGLPSSALSQPPVSGLLGPPPP
jgi:hypothetical protein